MSWTHEQVLALAPDVASAKAGQGLAAARKWQLLGHADQALWGECQGSAKDPYQTQIDLSGPVFKCSCPSRKHPCKHGLALLLLFVGQPVEFAESEAPAWVADWMAGRAKRREQKAHPAPRRAANGDSASAARRASERETRVAEGVSELERWLEDLVRRGLASLADPSLKAWDTVASRMVDAQAPGLARLVQEMTGLPATGAGWQERLAERVGRLHLLLQGYHRLEALSPETQADIRALIGWTHNQDDLLLRQGVVDCWSVLGQRVSVEDALRVRHTWLWGRDSNRPALVLDFAAPGQPLDTSLLPGIAFEGELVYFPGAFPLRALVKSRQPAQSLATLPGYANLQEAARAYSQGLAHQPWLEQFPVPLKSVRPTRAVEDWWLCDVDGRAWPIAPAFASAWELFALSGGQAIDVFGEWDGEQFRPLSAWVEGSMTLFSVEDT